MISILLCTLNRPVLVKNCIESLLAQSYRDLEIIVVDQSKDDETEKSCRSFPDERIKYHHVDFNGLSRARDYGLKYCKGGYVCLGDDDAEYDKDYLKTAADFLKSKQDPCILCGRIRCIDDRLKDAFAYNGYRNGQRLNADDMLQIAPSPALIFPAQPLKEIKGFDMRFGVGAKYGSGEETDVVFRLFKKGIKAYFLDDMRVFHGRSDEDPSQDLKKVYKYYAGLGALLKKHLWYGHNLALIPKAARATLGARIKYVTGDSKQKAIYKQRIKGFKKGFAAYRLLDKSERNR